MEKQLKKYHDKLVQNRLCHSKDIIMCVRDDDIVFNKEHSRNKLIEKTLSRCNMNSILLSRPAFPYSGIIKHIINDIKGQTIKPKDCESRTFLHDIPVAKANDPEDIFIKLSKRKGIITTDAEIITYGTVSPEQAFVTFSSICFACFVKVFVDLYYQIIDKNIDYNLLDTINNTLTWYGGILNNAKKPNKLIKGPVSSQEQLILAIDQAGKALVGSDMVDSFFGNISALFDDKIFISQTGSSLDELPGHIDAVPLDGTSCAGITASSELPAHKRIYLNSPETRFILHGHPKFCVIHSMCCDKQSCRHRGDCHLKCSEKRLFHDIPIVPGEVGSGAHGLDKTLPEALLTSQSAIVYGHGIFSTGQNDFIGPYGLIINAEIQAFDHFSAMIRQV